MTVSIEIPEWLYKLLRRRAEREGRTIEDLMLAAVADLLDPEARIDAYKRLFYKYLEDAERLYQKGDLVQAGEKLWGAVTALLNIIGELEEKPHYSHADYWDLVEAIAEVTNDPEYSTLFTLAERLHANYYHAFLRPMTFRAYWEAGEKLVEKLRRYLHEKHKIDV